MKDRTDFVRIQPKETIEGEVVHVSGKLVVRCSRGGSKPGPQEVTLAEWGHVLEPLGVFELATEAQSGSKKVEGAKTQAQETARPPGVE